VDEEDVQLQLALEVSKREIQRVREPSPDVAVNRIEEPSSFAGEACDKRRWWWWCCGAGDGDGDGGTSAAAAAAATLTHI